MNYSAGFGRCLVTGEFGPVVRVKLGEFGYSVPSTEKGVEYDKETGEVNFTVHEPKQFEVEGMFSAEALESMLVALKEGKNPIPEVSPKSPYMWRMLLTDGRTLSQFDSEGENSFKEVEENWGNVAQVNLVPFPGEDLPNYTLDVKSGTFFRNGQPIPYEELGYEKEFEGADRGEYFRKVTIVFGSPVDAQTGHREIETSYTSVLQVFGWIKGDKKMLIAVDDRGEWREWDYGD